MSGTVLEAMRAGAVFFGLTLPPGFALLRLLRVQATPLARLSMAMGLGLILTLSVLVLELALGGPWLVLPLFAASLFILRSDRSVLPSVRLVAADCAGALLLGAVALFANAGDAVRGPEGLSIRVGFDVSDRAFYGTVAQELERTSLWAVENPGFAPLPLQYSYLHSLAGVLLHRYAGIDGLAAYGACLPAIGLVLTGLSAAALAQAFGIESLARLLTMTLVALGGDLSFLVPDVNGTWLERTRHFFVFYSFGSESLFYNPWAFGLPIALTTILSLTVPGRVSLTALIAPSLLLAGLFQAKVFAFIPLWLAVCVVALLLRDARLLGVAALSVVLAAPGMALVALSGGAREGAPLGIEAFAFIKDAIASNPSLSSLADAAGVGIAGLVVFLGGLGFRLSGFFAMPQAMRSRGRAELVSMVATLIGVGLALILVGRPTRVDGVQFMLLPQSLLWIFAGRALAAMLARGHGFGLGALLMVGLSLTTPLKYLAMKIAPDQLTSPNAVDRRRFLVGPSTLLASDWLREHSPPGDRLVLPLTGDPEDRGGLKPLYVGLLASRRVVAEVTPFSVSPSLARERQQSVQRLFETNDASEGEALLRRLGAAWVWEDVDRVIRFSSPRLVPQATFGRTRILKVEMTR